MSKVNDDQVASKFLASEFPIKSSLISRLQTFLPELSAANQQLSKQQTPVDLGISIERIPHEDDKEESSGESDSDSSDESEEEGPRVEFDMHVIDDYSSDEEEPNQSEEPKKKLIEEID